MQDRSSQDQDVPAGRDADRVLPPSGKNLPRKVRKVRSKGKAVRPNPRDDRPLIWDHKLVEEMGELIAEIGKMQGKKGNIRLVREELADVEAALIVFKKANFPKKRDRKAFARRVAMKIKRAEKRMALAKAATKK